MNSQKEKSPETKLPFTLKPNPLFPSFTLHQSITFETKTFHLHSLSFLPNTNHIIIKYTNTSTKTFIYFQPHTNTITQLPPITSKENSSFYFLKNNNLIPSLSQPNTSK
jgi:hypothetical protein